MYDAKNGRFLQVDPIDKEGDPDSYPYVHNNPVNHIDPSGLADYTGGAWGPAAGWNQQVGADIDRSNANLANLPKVEKVIGSGHNGTILITGGYLFVPNMDSNQAVDYIMRAVRGAADMVDKALDLLEHHPDCVSKFFKFSGPNRDRLYAPDDQQKMISLLRPLQTAFNSRRTVMRVDPPSASATEGLLYTPFIGVQGVYETNLSVALAIEVRGLFFTSPDEERFRKTVHEFGRYYSYLGETATGTWKDVDPFESAVVALVANYDEIIKNCSVTCVPSSLSTSGIV